jgi:translation initiation factor IF-2
MPIIVRELAEHMGVKPNLLIAELMKMNIFASINQKIELKVAQQIAQKWGWTVEWEKKVEAKPPPAAPKPKPKPIEEKVDAPENIIERPPVVVFMGHVDHGKTSLLDKIRNSRVAAGEDGGITQHIGAYTVTLNDKKKHRITFLDTPGHEAFTAMRARGANLTDIAVIVIDGVDGVMPQTREAIQHAKAAKVAIMVALNKKDLRAFNADRVKHQLQTLGLTPEDWGGDVICCSVSALTGDGIPNFLENIIALAEILELKANPRLPARGYVIEARMETGMGPTATLLIRDGTLKVGDAILCGEHWGRVKALINDRGERVKQAGPSDAVKCLGLSGVPEAGAAFTKVADEKVAREEAEARQAAKRAEALAEQTPRRLTIEDLFQASMESGKKTLSIVLKADTRGSLEALQYAINNIKSDKVELQIVLAGIGNITVNDVMLASASKAVILGFHVSKESDVASTAKREGVEIRLYSVIYEMLDEVKELMKGLLEPIIRETVLGHAQVKQLFDLGKKGKVAGCLVTDGRVTARGRARVKRRGDVLYEGSVASLRRFQNEAFEVREGQECGIRLDNFGDFEAGDIIEIYEVEKIAQQL